MKSTTIFLACALTVSTIGCKGIGSGTANAHFKLGYKYLHAEKYDKSIKEFNLALPLLKKAYGNTHDSVAMCYLYLGDNYADGRKDFSTAVNYYDSLIRVDSANKGESHFDLIHDYDYLFSAYSQMHEHQKAKKCIQKCLELCEKQEDPTYKIGAKAFSLWQLASVDKSLGNTEQSKAEYIAAYKFTQDNPEAAGGLTLKIEDDYKKKFGTDIE